MLEVTTYLHAKFRVNVLESTELLIFSNLDRLCLKKILFEKQILQIEICFAITKNAKEAYPEYIQTLNIHTLGVSTGCSKTTDSTSKASNSVILRPICMKFQT